MIYLLRSTAVFAVRLLLSVAVVYRFSHAENKSIFAQRYGPHTLPDDTKHTNVRRAETKYKTNVKEKRSPNCESAFGAARRACRGKAPPSANADRSAA